MPQHNAISNWSINGRFFSQKMTGVQRYAYEIILALDALDALKRDEATLFVAKDARINASFERLKVLTIGHFASHGWEQVTLPRRTSSSLLNLCNRGVIAAQRQTICIHDANVFNCPESYSLKFRLLYRALIPFFARKASRLTTVSNYSAQELGSRFGIPLNRISVLHNGHEHALRWRADNSNIMQRHHFDRPFVLTIGSQARHKNIAMLLELAGALDEIGIDLAVAGGGGRIFAGDPSATKLNVRLLGYVSDDDLAALLSNALCLAFPSLTEGFGLPIVEAMAHGCPVIASDAACMPEICGNAALLASPTTPSAWVQKIKLLLGSQMLQDELKEKGRSQARRFSWHASAAGYLDLMRSLG